MVKINRDLCIGCGECAADCPVDVLHIIEGKAEVSGPCFQCGHCVAVCPVRAAAIPEYDMDDVEEYVPKTFDVNPENMLHAMKFRRSIRNFRPEKIEREKVEDILNAGRYTATARNKQACTFVFIQDQIEEFKALVWENMPDIIRTLQKDVPRYAGIFERFYEKWKADSTDDNFFYNTPAFMVISADNHPLDGGLAAANIENMAVAHGLGALYSGYMMRVISTSPILKKWLGIEEKGIAGCMLLGYPAVTYRRTAPRLVGHIIIK